MAHVLHVLSTWPAHHVLYVNPNQPPVITLYFKRKQPHALYRRKKKILGKKSLKDRFLNKYIVKGEGEGEEEGKHRKTGVFQL